MPPSYDGPCGTRDRANRTVFEPEPLSGVEHALRIYPQTLQSGHVGGDVCFLSMQVRLFNKACTTGRSDYRYRNNGQPFTILDANAKRHTVFYRSLRATQQRLSHQNNPANRENLATIIVDNRRGVSFQQTLQSRGDWCN